MQAAGLAEFTSQGQCPAVPLPQPASSFPPLSQPCLPLIQRVSLLSQHVSPLSQCASLLANRVSPSVNLTSHPQPAQPGVSCQPCVFLSASLMSSSSASLMSSPSASRVFSLQSALCFYLSQLSPPKPAICVSSSQRNPALTGPGGPTWSWLVGAAAGPAPSCTQGEPPEPSPSFLVGELR